MSQASPQSVATTFGNGRLGNQLSTFASIYAVWREFGIYNFISPEQLDKLTEVFDLPENKEDSDDWPYFVWNTGNRSPGKYSLFIFRQIHLNN